MKRVVTIGVYGTDQQRFFQALQQTQVDTFCDIRWRRGVRGAQYAFANSQRLQSRLAELGIIYLYSRELAPPPAVRQHQNQIDQQSRVAKRQRTGLDATFVNAYHSQVLANLDLPAWLQRLGDAQAIALCCVERDPQACHRSLLAAALQQQLGISVEHLLP